MLQEYRASSGYQVDFGTWHAVTRFKKNLEKFIGNNHLHKYNHFYIRKSLRHTSL